MTDDLRKSFEKLLKNGDYAEAEMLLKQFMKVEPKDRDAKMLYGTCRMLQGDTETAKRIHDELEPFYSNSDDIPKSEKSFWQKYHRWIIYGTAAALGIGVGVARIYREIEINTMSSLVAESDGVRRLDDTTVYAGPPLTYYCKSCGKPTKIAWGFIRDEKYYKELRAKVDKGLIPCETCGKDTPYTELGLGMETANGDKHD